VDYQRVEDLRAGLEADVVIVEGFKASGTWPRVVVWHEGPEEWVDWHQAVAVVAHGRAIDEGRRAAASRALPFFNADRIDELRAFLGRIPTG
jgi:molybdopterin-guanine dinucleotide biosynthesis protein